MPIRPATVADLPVITGLLSACGLATEGLEDCLADFLVAEDGRQLMGAAGLERRDGRMALLRSVAVMPDFRGKGIARALCQAIQAQAKRTGLGRLYLLTATAPDFFARLGYRPMPRDQAPPAIQTTAQFRELCPASAVLMYLDLHDILDKEAP